MNPEKVGRTIKALRSKLGYTQHHLADVLGVTDKAVSKWERGLSVPDISIVTKLSNLLNCDVDNLLEGNISYLDKTWQGLLILPENNKIYAGSEAYGKPLVYIFLSYFLLAGIGSVYIVCCARDRRFIKERLGNGECYGMNLIFLDDGGLMPTIEKNTMVVYDNPFIYGANLTKYFQRAMSHLDGISILTISKNAAETNREISFKNLISFQTRGQENCKQECVPIVFFPKKFFYQIDRINDISNLNPLLAEPMGNGTIAFPVNDEDDLSDMIFFLKFIKKRMNKNVYIIEEVAKNRGFIDENELSK